MVIRYQGSVDGVTAQQLKGFFVGWPTHPEPQTHLRILHNSSHVWLAFAGDNCVGFINALTDSVFYAYIPLLEVLPDYQGKGIGRELMRRMVETLASMYAIDICCDESLIPFYEACGFSAGTSMMHRKYDRQLGA